MSRKQFAYHNRLAGREAHVDNPVYKALADKERKIRDGEGIEPIGNP